MTKSKSGETTKDKKIEQYCSVCKKKFVMPVIEVAEDNEVLWLKCPGCDGVLPHMVSSDQKKERDGGDEENGDSDELAIEDIDIDKAREYNESDSYEVGEIIYHRSWNDYGKVMEKETLPGNRDTILIHFVNQGKIRLVERKK